MLSRFFLNNSNTKMLAPYAVDIAVTISSLIVSICFTFVESFDEIFPFVKWSCTLVSGNTNKSLGPKDRPTKLPSEWIRAHLLNSYFAFCKIVVKIIVKGGYRALALFDTRIDRPTRRENSRLFTILLFRILWNSRKNNSERML